MTHIFITFHFKTLEITPSQKPFQVIFNSVKGIHTGTYYRTIYPQNITLSIQDVFLTYMQKLIEFNENQETPLYLPSHLEDLNINLNILTFQIFKRKFRHIIIPIIGYNKIYYKQNTFNTDFFTILPLLMIQFLKSKSSLNFY